MVVLSAANVYEKGRDANAVTKGKYSENADYTSPAMAAVGMGRPKETNPLELSPSVIEEVPGISVDRTGRPNWHKLQQTAGTLTIVCARVFGETYRKAAVPIDYDCCTCWWLFSCNPPAAGSWCSAVSDHGLLAGHSS
jgi:hypothetical protein